MHLLYWRGQLEEVDGEVRRLIRGYEGIPTGVVWCMMRSPTAYYGEGIPAAGEAYIAHTVRTLRRMCHNQEKMVRRVCYNAIAEVQKVENMCPLCVAPTKAVGGGEEGTHVARPTGGVAGGGAHVGDQQDVRQAGTDPGSGHGL